MFKYISPDPKTQVVLSDSQARCEQTRTEMASCAGIGAFRVLLRSAHVRKTRAENGEQVYSAIDLVNVLADSKNEPRKLWNDTKKRLVRDDPNMSDEIGHIKFPLWNDTKKRLRASDSLTWHGAMILVFELHSELSNYLRHAIVEEWRKYPSEYIDDIMAELGRDVGWAGTAIRLQMQSIYEEGDYDNPRVPPGCPE